MEFVIDANILFAALIKPSYTRYILMGSDLPFFVPEKFYEELNKHLPMLLKKSKMNEEQLRLLLDYLNQMAKITLMPISTYKMQLAFAEKLSPDKDDTPYIALALTLGCPIWSNDKDLKKQNKVKVFNTEELTQIIFQRN